MRNAAGCSGNLVEFLVEDVLPDGITCREIQGYGKWSLSFAPAHHIAFGLVTEGRCEIVDQVGRVVSLCQGDFLLTAPLNGWTIAGAGQDFQKLPPSLHLLSPALRRAGAIDGALTTRIAAGYASLLDEQEYLQRWIGYGLLVRNEAALRLRRTLQCLEEEARATTGASFPIQRRLFQVLLLQAFQAQSLSLGNVTRPRQVQGAKGLFAALRAMQGQPEVEWTVATLAEVAFMSRSVFALRFEQMVGLPPLRYLREHRLDQAKTVLLHGAPVKQVASQVGYRSDKAFSTAFHHRFGQTPGSFRRSAWSDRKQDAC